MRVLSQAEIARLTKSELHALLRVIASEVPRLPENSPELRAAHFNLGNVRMLSRGLSRANRYPGFRSPGPLNRPAVTAIAPPAEIESVAKGTKAPADLAIATPFASDKAKRTRLWC